MDRQAVRQVAAVSRQEGGQAGRTGRRSGRQDRKAVRQAATVSRQEGGQAGRK
jgi:hypothetical protein